MDSPASLTKAGISALLMKLGYAQVSVFFGYLRASGWLRSLRAKRPVDDADRPLPWYSYPFIHFLEGRLQNGLAGQLRVFEFGSGNSTIWWAQRAKHVVSVEDDERWFQYVSSGKPANVSYKLARNEEQYIACLLDESSQFEVIVIDGSYRERCILEAVEKLSPGGVLVIDNSDWASLSPSLRHLEQRGFRQLEFYGLGPMNGHPWGTSILYRDTNILAI